MISDKPERINELEKELSYLVNDEMTAEQKIKRLSDAYWQASNSGFCDAMANKLMSGVEDSQTEIWEKNCKHKYEIGALIDLLTESKKEENEEC